MKRKKQIARIEALADKWLKPLGLLWWRKIEFMYYEDRNHFCEDGSSREAAMVTYPSWAYLEAVIEINLPAIAEVDDKTLEYYFVHEMVHLLTDEFEPSNEREGNIERVTTQIARAFIWVAEMLGEGNERPEQVDDTSEQDSDS